MKSIYFLSLLILLSCGENQKRLDKQVKDIQKIDTQKVDNQNLQKEEKEIVENSSKYSFESFETPNIGWGYSIFEGTKELIRQPHIPAVQGNQGFASKEQADRVAKEVIRKLENGIMPPTLSIEEMQKLGAI